MITPRYYQSEAELAAVEYYQSGGTGNTVLCLPTGTGKSLIIAFFIMNILKRWSGVRFMMLTHVKELIKQNADQLTSIWPTAPLGIYSAGLKSRDSSLPVIYGGIQSVANEIKRKAEKGLPHFGHRDIIIIDECHLLGPSDDTKYAFTLSELKKINPKLRVIGLTATPYRLKQGMLTDEGGIFDEIVYNACTVEGFNRLIKEGFLAPLIPLRQSMMIDTSNVGMRNGEFISKQLQEASDKDEITYEAVKSAVAQGYNRKSWLVFASGIEHAEHIDAMLDSFGVSSAVCHSKLKAEENDKRIEAFKRGEIQALVNNMKLTTGFDHPDIDLIVDLAPTMSPGLHVQKYGRGTRPCPGKENCLVLDFAGNTKRLGPINDPVLPRKPGKGGGGEAPIRICEACGMYNHASARVCELCGAEFSFETKLLAQAGTEEVIRTDTPVIERFEVEKVIYNRHTKIGKPPSIQVSYFCGMQRFREWVGLQHPGYAGRKARSWWSERHESEPPVTTDEALQMVSQLRKPSHIRVQTNTKYPEILGTEW